MQSFNLWKNLKRHIQEKHDKTRKFACTYCSFETKRNHDLQGHVERKHSRALDFIRPWLDEIVALAMKSCGREDSGVNEISPELIDSNIVEDDQVGIEESDDELSDESADNAVLEDTGMSTASTTTITKPLSIYPAVQRQLDNMAELRAHYLLAFGEEIREKELKEIEEKKRKEKRKAMRKERLYEKCEPTRRSSRLEDKRVYVGSVGTGTGEFEANSGIVRENGTAEVDVLNVEECCSENANPDISSCASDTTVEAGSMVDAPVYDHDSIQFESPADIPDNAKFCCLPCGLSFRDTGNLRRHVDLMHTVRKKAMACPRTWCSMEFFIRSEMLTHKISCLKVCSKCQKSFKWIGNYESHLRNHVALERRMV